MTNDGSDALPAPRQTGREIAATSEYVALRDSIVERQAWGDDVVGLLAQDIRARDDLGRGFSRRNLFYMRRFAALWPEVQFVQTLSAQIGWSHHQALLDTVGDDRDLYGWYAAKAIENRWSVRQLRGQIDLKLHLRAGAATANYATALGEVDGHAALAVTKDPYVLDFIDLTDDAKERELEDELVREIPRFLRELGVGFAYYGRQQPLEVGGQEFYLDLLFYHHRLRRFVVIDLKIDEFKAEFAGKMGLYLNAVDAQLRHPDDAESIGPILCTSHNKTVAKFALHRSGAPIAVADWQTHTEVDIADELPRDVAGALHGLPEVRDQLTSHVAETAERVGGRLLDSGATKED